MACWTGVDSSCLMDSSMGILGTAVAAAAESGAVAAACSRLARSHLNPFVETRPSGIEACCSYQLGLGASHCSGQQPHSQWEVAAHPDLRDREPDWERTLHPRCHCMIQSHWCTELPDNKH